MAAAAALLSRRACLLAFGSLPTWSSATSSWGDPEVYREPVDEEYWRPEGQTALPYQIERIDSSSLTREKFDKLILDGSIFIVRGMAEDWPLRTWDCDFFRKDPEFKGAQITHQYVRDGSASTLGDNWQADQKKSGAANDTAPQIAPFYWGIKDVQYEQRKGWKKSMLKRIRNNYKVPHFMEPKVTADSFSRTPEFWFGVKTAGAQAHMDSHQQATVSLQISGRKRWRLMPLRKRSAPFLAMIYQDGMPYTNSEGWRPLMETTLAPGEALFFPPGIIHETLSLDEECASSVTFQFNYPYAARFFRRFFPRVRRTADIHESWEVIRTWAHLGMPGDQKGEGASYADAKRSTQLAPHFQKVDKDKDGRLTEEELKKALGAHAVNALAWHDADEDGAVTLEEFTEGFAYWAAVTNQVISETPKKLRKYQAVGTAASIIENLEDLPRDVAEKALAFSLKAEAKTAKVEL
eukprot:TRINITY_DN111166_c0_g1_i1.p1 TRINITY_DN111166_c0_g1~~TRINITY_DN111166_c0_g1_i1.p1  ORF type:complete len:465 (+),score=121.68 TRINITY_DN111166_c0_g1_i1:73-1467(+)